MNKLLTMAELQTKTAPELRDLFARASMRLVRSGRFSRERQNLLATLENINLARDQLWRTAGGF